MVPKPYRTDCYKIWIYCNVLLMTSFPCCVIAQKVKEPGYVVLKNNDTIVGLIDNEHWSTHPRCIWFTDRKTNKRNLIPDSQVLYFEISGKRAFQWASVIKDTRPVKPNPACFFNEDEDLSTTCCNILKLDTVVSKKQEALLEILYKGNPLSLYELADIHKKHFYISGSTGDFTELSYIEYTSGPNLHTLNAFRRQLRDYVYNYIGPATYRQLNKAITKAGYNARALTALIIKIDNLVLSAKELPIECGPE